MKEYALAEIFDAVTMAPFSETETLQLEDVPSKGSVSVSAFSTSSVTYEKYGEDREEIEELKEQNNETLRKKIKKSSTKSKSESTEKSSLLKSLMTEYSRDERAKKNRRGRKSANLGKLIFA